MAEMTMCLQGPKMLPPLSSLAVPEPPELQMSSLVPLVTLLLGSPTYSWWTKVVLQEAAEAEAEEVVERQEPA